MIQHFLPPPNHPRLAPIYSAQVLLFELTLQFTVKLDCFREIMLVSMESSEFCATIFVQRDAKVFPFLAANKVDQSEARRIKFF
jgi:hypothetical protein